MMRLLGAIKFNHSALEGSLRWLSNQPGSKDDLSADGPLYSLPEPNLGFSIIITVPTKGVIVIFSHPNLSICLNFLCSVCPGVYVCRVAGPGPSRTPSCFCPMLCLQLCWDKYLKSRGNPCPRLLWPEVWQTCISCRLLP